MPELKPIWHQWLFEFQNKSVALADCEIFFAVVIAKPQGRRQGPDAFRIILRVLWIGVNLGRTKQLESGRLRKSDRVILTHIAALGLRILRRDGGAAMVFYAQNSARLERFIEGPERALGGARAHPIVEIVERQDEIGAARRSDILIAAPKSRHKDFAIKFWRRSDSLFDRIKVPLFRSRDCVTAAILKIRRKDFDPIACFCWYNLDNTRIGTDAEKGQHLQRMPVAVAGLVGLAPLRPGDNRGYSRIGLRPCETRERQQSKEAREGKHSGPRWTRPVPGEFHHAPPRSCGLMSEALRRPWQRLPGTFLPSKRPCSCCSGSNGSCR